MTLRESYIKDITITAARLLGEIHSSYGDLSVDAAFIVAALI